MITCWEAGRDLREQNPELAARAECGELVPLPWKGGTHNAKKGAQKCGALQYLAMWQGLRGEDLNIDLEAEQTVHCSRTGVRVIFKRALSDDEESQASEATEER
jgi:hypothetical protein